MIDSSPLLLAAGAATFFAAGLVKGVTGMGLPTVAMGVLGALLSPLTAASLLVVPSAVTNLWQLLAGPSFGVLLRRLWLMMAGIVVGSLAGLSLLTSADTGNATAALGCALVAYALFTLLAAPFAIATRAERWASPLVGLATGVIGGGTGVFVIPAVPYLQSLGLAKDDLVQALGLSFTVSTFALAFGLAWYDAYAIDNLALSAFAVVPALLGMAAGQFVRGRVSPANFRRAFLIFLLLLGLEMLLRPLRG